MSLIIKEDPSEYPLCPDGLHSAVIVDTVDLGMQSSPWGEKHRLSIVLETQLQDEDGKNYILIKKYNWSLHEKSSLRRDLERLLGKKFTSDELLAGVNLENLIIGMSCNILVVHNETEDRTYANIESILPYKDSATGKISYFALKPSGEYIRVKDRPDYQPPEEYSKATNGVTEKEGV